MTEAPFYFIDIDEDGNWYLVREDVYETWDEWCDEGCPGEVPDGIRKIEIKTTRELVFRCPVLITDDGEVFLGEEGQQSHENDSMGADGAGPEESGMAPGGSA